MLDTQFGAGLDFLTTWQSWRTDTLRPLQLHYAALACSPPSLVEMLREASSLAEAHLLISELATHWHDLRPGFHRICLAGGGLLLTLCVGELAPLLRQQRFLADAVFLGTKPTNSAWDPWTVKTLARCCRRGALLHGSPPGACLSSYLVQSGFELALASETGMTSMGAGIGSANADANAAASLKTTPTVLGQFNPRWAVKHTRTSAGAPHAISHPVTPPGTCAVIGAGLAGASVAAALARRGWRVVVLDADAAPAAGASGLPVGLLVPHVSGDDCTLSRLSRSGVWLTLQQAQQWLVKGQDWDATGVLERRAAAGLTDPAAALCDVHPACAELAELEPGVAQWDQTIWHAQAAWLKPAPLVCAWLTQPGVTFQGQAEAAGLRRDGTQWAVLNAAGQVLALADRVVIANAMGALPLLASVQSTLTQADALLAPLPKLQGVRGQVSWGLHGIGAGVAQAAAQTPRSPATLATASATPAPSAMAWPALPGSLVPPFPSFLPFPPPVAPFPPFPPFPVNGSGSVVAHVPTVHGPAWYVGANYQPEVQPALPAADNHRTNLARLAQLLPALGAALAPRFDAGAVSIWENTRCVTNDRLPLVGPLTAPLPVESQSSLWLCAGMGSRGLTFSVLCAELLAATWGGEPLPIEASLAAALDTRRRTGFAS